jgi:hypothetical protein
VPDSTTGRVQLLDHDPRERENVFSLPVDEEINDAVRQLPGRWFDWRRKNWRAPPILACALVEHQAALAVWAQLAVAVTSRSQGASSAYTARPTPKWRRRA